MQTLPVSTQGRAKQSRAEQSRWVWIANQKFCMSAQIHTTNGYQRCELYYIYDRYERKEDTTDQKERKKERKIRQLRKKERKIRQRYRREK